MANNTLVIKLGGTLLESDEALTALFDGLTQFLNDSHRPLVLVHGGGCLVDDLLKGLGLKSTKKNGLRVTPFEHIPLIAGALAGTANKQMMAKAIAHGIKSVGLCLADGAMCKVTQLDPELGAVGECQPNEASLVQAVLQMGCMPVISSIGITAQGELMNVNADQAATAIAELLSADLVMLSDVSGILDGKGQLIPEMTQAKAEELIAKGVITGGMEVKVRAALHAAATLGRPIAVASWRYPEQLSSLLAGGAVGTKVMA